TIAFIFQNCKPQSSSLEVIKNNKPITKAEMKIISELGIREITITDIKVLDSLTKALSESSESIAQRGRELEFKMWSDIKIHKNNEIANIFVQFSEYSGWHINVGNKSLKCDYVLKLIRESSPLLFHQDSNYLLIQQAEILT